MADKQQLRIIKSGVEAWNAWRRDHPSVIPDLGKANLSGQKLVAAQLHGANLAGADLHGANLSSADLRHANLSHAHFEQSRLSQANLLKADLSYAHLAGAWLNDAILIEANLFRAQLTDVTLINARLTGAILIGTNLQRANLKGSSVQSVFAWGVKLKDANQTNLIVSHPKMPKIIVDNLEIAQLVHLRLYKENDTRHFDAIPNNIIVILGRFSKGRSEVLATLQDSIRHNSYIPLKVDCDEKTTPDFGTLSALASLAQFFVIDVTEPCASISSLQDIVFPLATPVHCIMQQNYLQTKNGSSQNFLLENFFSPLFYHHADELHILLEETIFAPNEVELTE
jgi:uncharacterized protein YjbI with pentapeptide repeats